MARIDRAAVAMKGLSAGLIFVTFSTVCALALGLVGDGLSATSAWLSFIVGALAAAGAYLGTFDSSARGDDSDAALVEAADTGQSEQDAGDVHPPPAKTGRRHSSIFFWLMAGVFAIFAVRSFCWLLYVEGDELKIQSPNNLGDLALHITYIKDFANGSPLWPLNPIYPVGKLRYPAGPDLFNGLLCLVHIDLIPGLVWAGLLASVATFYALFRWGGAFAVAGFLFNGGIAGFEFLNTLKFVDYQGVKTIAWKSLPLSMFVTQRGLLYAIPVGLLLLWHWREKFFRSTPDQTRGPLPFWVELSLYASLPLFHFHTFLALTIVLVALLVCGDPPMRGQILTLLGSALIPATFFVWLITDHFHARSVVEWHPGWVMSDPDFGRSSFVLFWWDNFGIFIPLALILFGLCGWRAWKSNANLGEKLSEDLAFLAAAAAIVTLALLVKLAPWEWDNLKIMIWAYFILLPFLWRYVVAPCSYPFRIALCLALFGSGFITLFGGLAAGRPGFEFATRSELDGLGEAIKDFPVEARFATYPTYNHPLLLQGRNVVLGYAGHLWTQGFDYTHVNHVLTDMMQGQGDWRATAQRLGARYIFWGREEKTNYPNSARPWENVLKPVASGAWGAIYDVAQPQPAVTP